MSISHVGRFVALAEAVDILAGGGVLAFPTETYYALGCNAADESAVSKVYQLKKRTATKPLPLVFGNIEMLFCWMHADAVNPMLLAFWPGPLTLLLRPKRPLPSCLVDEKGLVAARVSPHSVPRFLSESIASPLTASSANVQSRRPARVSGELEAEIARGADGILCEGPEPLGGKPSTIVEPLGGESLLLVREGAVSRDALEAKGFSFA